MTLKSALAVRQSQEVVEFDQKELRVGALIETEHTKDFEAAKEIAKAHLREDPRYYVNLRKSVLLEKAKYLKRTGGPGHYKYTYREPVGRKRAAKPIQPVKKPKPVVGKAGAEYERALVYATGEQGFYISYLLENVDLPRIKNAVPKAIYQALSGVDVIHRLEVASWSPEYIKEKAEEEGKSVEEWITGKKEEAIELFLGKYEKAKARLEKKGWKEPKTIQKGSAEYKKKLADALVKKYGETKDVGEAGLITSDGRMVRMGGTDETLLHTEMAVAMARLKGNPFGLPKPASKAELEESETANDYIFDEMFHHGNLIRMNYWAGEPFLHTTGTKVPNEKQFKAIEKFLGHFRGEEIRIHIEDEKRRQIASEMFRYAKVDKIRNFYEFAATYTADRPYTGVEKSITTLLGALRERLQKAFMRKMEERK